MLSFPSMRRSARIRNRRYAALIKDMPPSNQVAKKVMRAKAGAPPNRFASEGGVTNQYSVRTMYRKRRRTRRSKRSRRKKRSIARALTSLEGCSQFVFSHTGTVASAQGAQGLYAISLFAAASASPSNDATSIYNALAVQGVGTNARKNSRIYVQSQCLDLTLCPTTSAVTADIDIYIFRCTEDNSTNVNGIDGAFSTFLTSQQKPDGSAATNLVSTTMGVTPFQAPQFCRYWTCLSKRKIILTQNQVYHYQYRVKKPMWINTERISSNVYLKGTIHVMYVVNGITVTSGAGTNFPAVSVTCTEVRTYNCKHDYLSDDRAISL